MRMTWPHKRKLDEADAALAEARKNLERIQKRSVEITKVTQATKKLVERNRFAERIEGIMGG